MASIPATRDRWNKGFGPNPAKMQDFAWLGDDMNLYDAATESSRSKNSFKMGISTNDFYVYFFSG